MAIKLSSPRAFQPVVTVVTVVIAPFFVAIIIATWSGGLVGARSAARRGLLDGSLRLANGSNSLFEGLESHLGDDAAVGDLVVMR